ncbi:MAG: hypothetical protein HC816_22230, partial [Leptolyngbyaceae cyanobacterium RM1_1_2]|nr:hypothetical protein [Leptolyngbyaceae cyanobacterium RM1_1_2]
EPAANSYARAGPRADRAQLRTVLGDAASDSAAAAIADLATSIEHHQAQLAAFDPVILEDYEKLRGRLKEERRLLKILRQQAEEALSSGVMMSLSFALTGTVLSLKGKHVKVSTPLPAVLVSKIPGPGQFPYLVCLGQDNRWYVVTVADVIDLHDHFERLEAVEALSIPADLPLKPGQNRSGDEATAPLAQQIPQPPTIEELAPEVLAQRSQVEALEALANQHPAQQWKTLGHCSSDRSKCGAYRQNSAIARPRSLRSLTATGKSFLT